FVVGGKLLEGRNDREISFVLAQQLAATRPERYLRSALPSRRQLEAVYLAALLAAAPDLPVTPAQAGLVKSYLPRVRARAEAARERLLPAVERWRAEGG